jgi:protein TonB
MLGSALIQREPAWRRLGASVAVAVILHVAALALLARAPVSRARRPAPPIEVVLVRASSPPAPPAGDAAEPGASLASAGARVELPGAKRRSRPIARAVPVAQTRLSPVPATARADGGRSSRPTDPSPVPATAISTRGDSGPLAGSLQATGPPLRDGVAEREGAAGGAGGVATSADGAGAPGGGVGGGEGPARSHDAKAAARVDFDDAMTPPRFVSGPGVEYVQQALDREVEGTMVVRCVVTVEGAVHDCRVLKGLPFMNAAVVGALERRRYSAATLGGRPLDVNYTFRIRLVLPR